MHLDSDGGALAPAGLSPGASPGGGMGGVLFVLPASVLLLFVTLPVFLDQLLDLFCVLDFLLPLGHHLALGSHLRRLDHLALSMYLRLDLTLSVDVHFVNLNGKVISLFTGCDHVTVAAKSLEIQHRRLSGAGSLPLFIWASHLAHLGFRRVHLDTCRPKIRLNRIAESLPTKFSVAVDTGVI